MPLERLDLKRDKAYCTDAMAQRGNSQSVCRRLDQPNSTTAAALYLDATSNTLS